MFILLASRLVDTFPDKFPDTFLLQTQTAKKVKRKNIQLIPI